MATDKCPTCGGSMKINVHSINRPMARALDVLASQHDGTGSISHIGLSHPQICNFHKMKHWGLVESLGGGMWRVTARGYRFLDGSEAIPKYAHTFHDKLKEYKGELITIRDYIEPTYKLRSDYAKEQRSVFTD